MTGRTVCLRMALVLLASVWGGCDAPTPVQEAEAKLEFEGSARPATEVAARDPRLVVRASGMIALAQVESEGEFEGDLVVYRSESGGDLFSDPVKVNRGGGRVLAHGEGAPVFLEGPRSQFHAVWIANRPGGGRALLTSRSKDFLQSFEEPVVIAAGSRGEPAFFDATVAPDGRVAAGWLARAPAGTSLPGTSALLTSVTTEPGGDFGPPVVVATDVCPCCRPALIAGEDSRLHLAWRTTDEENVRSMVISTSTDEGRTWSEPQGIPEVGWKINGCPHSGPALAYHDRRLHVAWYSEAEGSPRLYWSREQDTGGFSAARELSGGVRDANHPFLGVADGRLFAAFQGRSPDEPGGWPPTGVYVAEIAGDVPLPPVAVPRGPGTAAYPRLRALGAGRLLVAWTDHEQAARRVMVARARLDVP